MRDFAIIAGITLAVLLGAWRWHVATVDTAVEAARAQWQADLDADRAESEREARDIEAAHRSALAAVETHYQQELEDAQSRADHLVSDLRAGNVRLRSLWQGCENAAARVPATATTPAGVDALAELRAAAAARIVRVGAQCDAQIRGLQAALTAATATGEKP
jgi:hypothetical protein